MNLITIIIIILILILLTGVLLIFCNSKDLEYNYTKFIGGDAEELSKDIQENESKQVVSSDIYDEFAQDPVVFLQKRLMNVPILVATDNKAVIDFAQETILKAIKGE